MVYSASVIDAMTTEELRQAAFQTGDAEVQFILARRLYSGYKAVENEMEGLYWFTQAANQGHLGAVYNFFDLYKEYFFEECERNHWDVFLNRSHSRKAEHILEEYNLNRTSL